MNIAKVGLVTMLVYVAGVMWWFFPSFARNTRSARRMRDRLELTGKWDPMKLFGGIALPGDYREFLARTRCGEITSTRRPAFSGVDRVGGRTDPGGFGFAVISAFVRMDRVCGWPALGLACDGLLDGEGSAAG
jgi:hypothetical protein